MVCLAYGWVLSIRFVGFATYLGLQLISAIVHGARYVPLSLIN